jgi:hypothetical protein
METIQTRIAIMLELVFVIFHDTITAQRNESGTTVIARKALLESVEDDGG